MATISGGTKFEAALAEIAAKFAKPRTLNVGFLANSSYPDGTSVALVAAVQNFGAPSRGIPPRPFFSTAVRTNAKGWPAVIAGALQMTGNDVDAALAITGEHIKGQIQLSIRNTMSPPLAPATIAAKGHSKPLVDSGHMQSSVDYEITG